MTGRLHHRLDKLGTRIEERSSAPEKDAASLSPKEIARIANYIHMRGLSSDATEKEKESSRKMAEMFPVLRR
jgi:hypothetical protein